MALHILPVDAVRSYDMSEIEVPPNTHLFCRLQPLLALGGIEIKKYISHLPDLDAKLNLLFTKPKTSR